MSRFYVPKDSVKGNLICISGSEARHIADVMRLKVPDKVVAFDGTGKEYIGFIKNITTRSVVLEIVETRTPRIVKPTHITLIQAIPKKDKMDYIVEKSTELGASRIIPIFTRRTIPSWDGPKKAKAVERWRKIAVGASKQCGRADIPEINAITDLSGAISECAGCDLRLIAALDDKAVRLKDVVKGFGAGDVAIAIGPEGDFTADEIKDAQAAGFKLINLGSRVLKSDTAGLFVLAILNYELTK